MSDDLIRDLVKTVGEVRQALGSVEKGLANVETTLARHVRDTQSFRGRQVVQAQQLITAVLLIWWHSNLPGSPFPAGEVPDVPPAVPPAIERRRFDRRLITGIGAVIMALAWFAEPFFDFLAKLWANKLLPWLSQ